MPQDQPDPQLPLPYPPTSRRTTIEKREASTPVRPVPATPVRLVVTGASGFLGGRLTQLLAEQGHTVRILARPSSDLTHLAGLPFEILRTPITDIRPEDLADVTHIYHCAGASTDWAPYDTYYQSNVVATQALLLAARTALTQGSPLQRFLHISTSDVYGYPRIPCDESHPLTYTGLPYNETKCLGEAATQEAHDQAGLPVTILRPATIYGPRGSAFVTDIVALLKDRSMALFDHGRTRGGFTYVDNVANAMIAAAHSPNTIGRAYNITDGTNITWREYVHALADGLQQLRRPWLDIPSALALPLGHAMEIAYRRLPLPGRPLLTRHAVLLLARDQAFPITRAQNDFAYAPAISFEEGMNRTIDWARHLSA